MHDQRGRYWHALVEGIGRGTKPIKLDAVSHFTDPRSYRGVITLINDDRYSYEMTVRMKTAKNFA